jgi:hypothetical protein
MLSHFATINGIVRKDSAKVLRVERDQMITGPTRSSVQHIRFARTSGTRWAGPECPLLAPEPHMGRFGSRDEIHTRMNNTSAAVSVSKV